ncbi:hypothetical protein FOZ61_001735 [Perkinsus olseni]|uniref:Uncharacterized protein n=1 Tax=Perkinsus olseni TaxID=32597 RepID=A0A7J6LWH8_PEROL|nr:hypothetical protein FOZ61_001735 [Perkinsus olseni]KAF4664437.1 hypothetical protein FOL46_004239 [Perkinsus olseni]
MAVHETMATAPVADAANPTIDDANLHDVTDTCSVEDKTTPALPPLRKGETRVTIAVGNIIVSESTGLPSVREKVKITVGVLGTIFEGSIVENHEEVVADSDSDDDDGGESSKEIEEAEERPLPIYYELVWQDATQHIFKDLAFRKKLLHNIDQLGFLPVEIELMMTEEFREEVEAATGKKGSTEIEELAQHVEAIASKCTRTVHVDTRQLLNSERESYKHSSASVSFPLLTSSHSEQGASDGSTTTDTVRVTITVDPPIVPVAPALEAAVPAPDTTRVKRTASVESFRAAVEQIIRALEQPPDEDKCRAIMTLKEDTLRPAVIRVLADMIEKGPCYYHSMNDKAVSELKAEAFSILSSHVSSVLRTPDTPGSTPITTEDTLTKSMRLAWEAEFVYRNYTSAAWEYKRQIVIKPRQLAADEETFREHRRTAWMRYSAFLRRCPQQMEAAAEHALREAVMLGYSREALCYLGCTLICRGRYEEASGILDRVFMRLSTVAYPLVNLVKAVNLHGQGDVDGCCRYLGLATRDKTFFRGLKTEQQIFDKLRSGLFILELLLLSMQNRLYDGAEHHQGPHGGSGEDGGQGLVTGDVADADDSPRSAHTEERIDSTKARLGLYHNLLPPVPTAELYLAPPDHTTLTLLEELVVDHSLYDFANLVGLAVRQVRKEIGSTSFLSQVFRQWCEFHHLVAVSLAHQGHWDEAIEVLERIAKKAISMALTLAGTSRLPSESGEPASGHVMLHADCWGLMSLVLLRGGPSGETLQQPRKCFDLYMLNDPVNVQLLTEVGFAWLSRGMPSLAEVAACRALELEASGPGHWLYGCALCERGRVQQGVLELQTAISLLWSDEIQRAEIVAAAVKYSNHSCYYMVKRMSIHGRYLQNEQVPDPGMVEAIYAANKVAQNRQDSEILAPAGS